jgi:hypothetical protein
VLAAEDRGHAGGRERTGCGHLRAAAGRERDRLDRREGPGHGGGSQLADAVAGDHALDAVGEAEPAADDHAECHQQRLGDGGVLDLVGVGGGAEALEVEPGDLAELGQLRADARQLEPRGEHAGGLGALAGGEHSDHDVHNDRSDGTGATATPTALAARLCRNPPEPVPLLR